MQFKDLSPITTNDGTAIVPVQLANGTYANVKLSDLKTILNVPTITATPNPDGTAYPASVLSAQPWFYYRFNNASPYAESDHSGNGFTGIYIGTPISGQSGLLANDIYDASYQFTGTQYCYCTSSYSTPTTFTLEAVFKTSAANGTIVGFAGTQTGTGGNFDREIMLTSGKLKFFYYSGASITTSGTYNDGNKHIVTVISINANITMYVDGTQVGTVPAGAYQSYVGYWRVGYGATGGFYTGYISEVFWKPVVDASAAIIARHKLALGLP
jgi:hypothetical protein